MPKCLLFNIKDPAKRSLLSTLALRLNCRMIDVDSSSQNAVIRDLLSRSVSGASLPSAVHAFTDEMLVINGMTRGDLDFMLNEMNRCGCTVALKAVVTDINQHWTAGFLHDTLVREAASMNHPAGRKKT